MNARIVLLAELDTLHRRLALAEPREDGPGDIVDLTVRTRETELGATERDRLMRRRRQIGDALARLAAGTYGRCVDCGERIAPARLTAVPETDVCLSCAATRERSCARSPERSVWDAMEADDARSA